MNSRWSNSSALVSVAAISALALSACASEDMDDDDDDAQPTATVTETVEATPSEEPTEESTATDDATPTEDATGSTEAGGDEEIYQAVDAVTEEYPDATVLDMDTEGSYYEFTIYEGDSEWELDLDRETMEITNTQQDDIDSDDQRNAEAVEIEFADALRTASEEGDGTPEQADLDDENGAVTWEIELNSGTEVYVDVATGEVVSGNN